MNKKHFKIRRRGFAVVIVLALLSVTLALSYAMMRVQATTNEIQRNMGRQADARQAAISGISAGVREMYKANWPGVESTLTMSLGNHRSYSVRYETGDPWLDVDDPDYDELPFRVTVISTGYARDSATTTLRSEYTIRAVVQLVRRKLQTNPNEWQAAAGKALYSYGTGDSYLEAPWQVHGDAVINGQLHLCEDWETTKRPFSGYIDEIAIYNRALSGWDVFTMTLMGNQSNSNVASALNTSGIRNWWRFNESEYWSTTAIDSIGGRNGTYKGGVYPGIDVGGGNKAVLIDGVSGRIDLGDYDLPSHSSFSIAAWIRPTNMSGVNENGRIISRANGTDAYSHWWMFDTTRQGNSYYPRTRLKTTSSFYEKSPKNGSLLTGSWNFVVLTFDGGSNELKIYANGYERDSWTAYGDAQPSSNLLTWIGDNPPGAARSRLLEDLARLANEGSGDYRPFRGNIALSNSTNEMSTVLSLYRQVGCSVNYQSPANNALTNTTITGSSYQLYPGGALYEIPQLYGTIQSTTLGPDPAINPLGLYRSNGSVTLRDQVSLQGTLISQSNGGKVRLRGKPITIQALDLPSLDGDETVYQLPALIAANDVEADSDVQLVIEGAVTSFGEIFVDPGESGASFQLTGMVFTDSFDFQACESWQNVANYSATHFQNFLNIKGQMTTENFVSWLNETTSGKFENRYRITLPADPPTYQWIDLSQPLYQVGDGDIGLVWELVRWKDVGGT